MSFLKFWLFLVAFLRLLSVIIGYFQPEQFQFRLFTNNPNEVSPLAARSFAVWTLLTCSCCILCAFNLNSRPIYLLTIWSFIVALAWFILELFIYETVTYATALSPFIVASLSIIFMVPNIPNNNKRKNE